eukprot:ANDGO_01436.mRNA.1 hypothetical protein TTHERM_00157880
MCATGSRRSKAMYASEEDQVIHDTVDPYDAIHDLPVRVTELHISKRQLKYLHPNMSALTNLETLWVNNNLLAKIDGLVPDVNAWKSMSVTSKPNPMEAGAFRIKHLYAGNNQLTTLAGSLQFLNHIELLDVSNNKLKDMERQLSYIKHLRNVLYDADFSGNDMANENNYRILVIYSFPNLHMLDKRLVTAEERHKAQIKYGIRKIPKTAFGAHKERFEPVSEAPEKTQTVTELDDYVLKLRKQQAEDERLREMRSIEAEKKKHAEVFRGTPPSAGRVPKRMSDLPWTLSQHLELVKKDYLCGVWTAIDSGLKKYPVSRIARSDLLNLLEDLQLTVPCYAEDVANYWNGLRGFLELVSYAELSVIESSDSVTKDEFVVGLLCWPRFRAVLVDKMYTKAQECLTMRDQKQASDNSQRALQIESYIDFERALGTGPTKRRGVDVQICIQKAVAGQSSGHTRSASLTASLPASAHPQQHRGRSGSKTSNSLRKSMDFFETFHYGRKFQRDTTLDHALSLTSDPSLSVDLTLFRKFEKQREKQAQVFVERCRFGL